jgi:hypothetical protein
VIRKRLPLFALAAFLGVMLAMLACGAFVVSPTASPVSIWTPAPIDTASAPLVATVTDVPLPTAEPAITSTLAIEQTPTPFLAAPESSTVAPAATPAGPYTVTVTDADIAKSVASGVVGENGVNATNLQVHFTGGKVHITADSLTYGFVSVSDLAIVGTLVARDGTLQMETDSVSPGGLVGAMIPPLVNQALKNYGSQWYIEKVQTGEGKIELTVR